MKTYLLACILLLLVGGAASANQAGMPNTQIGIGGHPLFANSPYSAISDDSVFALLQAKHLNRYRFDVMLANDTAVTAPVRMQSLIAAGKKYGIRLEPELALPFSWGDRTDGGLYPAGDSAALYSQGFNRTYAFVSQFANDVQDWELQNELNLLARDASGNMLFGKGWTAAEFDQPLMNDWASVLHGMSDAIDRVMADKNVALRRIVGTTSTMFGYLDFMLSKGVKIDVVGYHYYEHLGADPNNYWGGTQPNFNLFTKLNSYGKPVYVNEFNCAEIYDASYTNVARSASMNACNTNLQQMLTAFTGQAVANIEALQVYELLDETQNSGAEAHFGFLYDMATSKPMLDTLSTFAVAGNVAALCSVPLPIPPTVVPPPPSGAPTLIFQGMVALLNHVATAPIAPTTMTGIPAPNCSGVLLPAGMSIDPASCVISGTPNYASIPAGGSYVTSTIMEQSKSLVAVMTFTIN
jgi:hypothetical protein